MHPNAYLRRKEASEYCTARGLPVAPATLAKYATLGGGPEFRKFSRFPLYEQVALDCWIESKLTGPRRSTSDVGKGA
jgi:hypothetical protein